MSGTTLCPHCDTRFKIIEAQLEAHHGMVRCGHCLQAFDARPGFIPDQPSPQLELPILNKPVAPADELPVACATEVTLAAEEAEAAETGLPEMPRDVLLDFRPPAAVEMDGDTPAVRPMTLAEQVVIVQDEDNREPPLEYRKWPWAIAAVPLLLVLFAQTAYFFRVDLAARLPDLKPVLTGYCQLLGCNVPLPQKASLMGIESSDLEADPAYVNQITLNALLHNRAPYPQAFPNLELTLNDTQDKPLARRIFKPKDYLPPLENEKTGLLPNHELGVKLHLDTADLRPTGYRLVLFYPRH